MLFTVECFSVYKTSRETSKIELGNEIADIAEESGNPLYDNCTAMPSFHKKKTDDISLDLVFAINVRLVPTNLTVPNLFLIMRKEKSGDIHAFYLKCHAV